MYGWPHCTCKHFDCHGNSKAFVGSLSLSLPLPQLTSPLSPPHATNFISSAPPRRPAHSLANCYLVPPNHYQSRPPTCCRQQAAATCHIWLFARTVTALLALALASGAATKNATCEIIVSLVGRRRCQIHTDTYTDTHTHKHTDMLK